MQRLLAQSVACQQKLLFAFVIDCEGKHASQLLHAIWTHLFVEMNDYFGVSVGAELVTVRDELGPELGEVIDFAVEDDPGAAVFIEHRLVATGKINDAQTAHAEPGAVLDEDALIVGPAMHNLLAHAVNGVLVDARAGPGIDDSRDSAHVRPSHSQRADLLAWRRAPNPESA